MKNKYKISDLIFLLPCIAEMILYWDIFNKYIMLAIFSVIILVYVFHEYFGCTLLEKMLLLFYALIVWVREIADVERLTLVLNMLGAIVLLAYFFYTAKAGNSHASRCTVKTFPALAFVYVLLQANGMKAYTFESGGFIHLWYVPLALALIAAAVFVFFKCKRSGRKFRDISVLVLLIFFLSFNVALSSAYHLNYLLDFESDGTYNAQIVDKTHRNRRKSLDTYSFELYVNGTNVKMNVSLDMYYSYDTGDTLAVNYYDGAFGDAFYMIR